MMKNAALALVVGMAAFAMVSHADSVYGDWHKYREITINTGATGANVPNALTNFPVLLRLASTDSAAGADVLAEADSTGADIRFTNATGDTAYHYEIDTWTPTSAAVWVLIPTVAGNGETKFRMYWGNDTASSASNGSAVFPSAQYVGVWHLGNPTGDPQTSVRPNSVGDNNHATPVNLPSGYATTAGVIGGADTLGGGGSGVNGQHFDFGVIGESVFDEGGAVTISLWVKPTSLPSGFMQYMTIGNTQGGPNSGGLGANATWFGKNGSGTNRLSSQNITETTNTLRTEVNTTDGNNSALVGEWQFVAFTVEGTNHSLYSQGALHAFRADGQVLSGIERLANYIGRATWDDPTLPGLVDEGRVVRAARSADWIKLEFETQKPGATAVVLGATVDITPPDTTPPDTNGSRLASGNPLRQAGHFSREGTFSLASGSVFEVERLTLTVSDIWGRTVWSKTVHPARDGSRELTWNGASMVGGKTAPGMYMVRATVVSGGKASHHVQRMVSARPN